MEEYLFLLFYLMNKNLIFQNPIDGAQSGFFFKYVAVLVLWVYFHFRISIERDKEKERRTSFFEDDSPKWKPFLHWKRNGIVHWCKFNSLFLIHFGSTSAKSSLSKPQNLKDEIMFLIRNNSKISNSTIKKTKSKENIFFWI